MGSILSTIKKMLGMDPEYKAFDVDIIVGINSALMALCQLGVGPSEGFSIEGEDETWDDFLGGRIDLEAAKTYTYLKVRLMFDPPSSSFVVESINRQLSEYEWRLNINGEVKT